MNQAYWSSAQRNLYDSLTRGAAWVDAGERTELWVTGRDRIRVINNFCTADIKQLRPGQGAEAFFLNVKGAILGHCACFLAKDGITISTVPKQAEILLAHMRQYIVSESVEFEDRSPLEHSYLLAGPQAADSLRQMGVETSLTDRLDHGRSRLRAFDVAIRNTDLIGAAGFEIVVPADSSADFERTVLSQDVANCPAEILEVARIENRIPKFGVDIESKNLPQEIGRDRWAISFTKGCYLGQETVARLDSLGHVNRHLVAIGFDGMEAPPAGTVVELGGKPILRVTSSTWSPKLARPMALAFVRDEMHRAGQVFDTPFGSATVLA